MQICCQCKKRQCESIDDWTSSQCSYCNDRDIERNNNRAEWAEYHDEPCPEIELNKRR